MSFKALLHIGYFDPVTGVRELRRIDVQKAREAIVLAGGFLLEQNRADQHAGTGTARKVPPDRETLGYLGSECVILHQSGFLVTTIGYGPHAPMLAFLGTMCRAVGCQVYSPDEGKVITEEILAWLAARVDDPL